jgi:membrane associated rhomboid family serine protease
MFPLRDDNPTTSIPGVTLAVMGACVAVWVFVQGAGRSPDSLLDSVCAFGAIPWEVTQGVRGGTPPRGGVSCPLGGLTWQGLFTSMFLHGGWLHLIGNLWFLWIFGNNIEDSMGHLRFLAFYIVVGLVASGAHVLSDPASTLPMVGASGAISGIMGAYLLLYPKARVHTLFVIILYIRVFPVPAWFFLGYWFLLQVASSSLQAPGAQGGVAFWAHIGGFLAGLVLVKLFQQPELVTAKRIGARVERGPWGRTGRG